MENNPFKSKDGKQLFLLGVNYWPSSTAIHMWSDWHPEELEQDILMMKRLGMNCCRPFLFMPDFTDNKGAVRPEMLERLCEFLALCDKYEFYCMVTFIVGHMSGENWDVPWRKGRCFIRDKDVFQITQNYILTIVNAVKQYTCICSWLLSNELPNYIEETDPKEIADWTGKIISAIKEADPHHPVSVGDGAWSPEIIGEQTGFHLRKLNAWQDFAGLHYYPRGLSPWHHTYTTAFRLALAKEWGKPVIVEEFGTSTTLCSEENQAAYYRSVFYSALINDAQGALGWCLNDFDFMDERPYSHHPFEEHFGIVRTDKSLKPAANEFSTFSEMITDLSEFEKFTDQKPVGLFIPSNYYYEYPFQFQPGFKQWYDLYLETFSLLKRANLDVRMIIEPAQELEKQGQYSHELSLNPEEIPLLVIPRMKLMTKRFRVELENYIQKGGSLYFSFAHDSWVPKWDKLAGIDMDCKFGIPDFYPEETIKIKVSESKKRINIDNTFQIPLLNTDPEYGYCPVLKTSADTILEYNCHSPFLLRHSMGKGSVWFSPFPLEMLSLASQQDEWKRELGQMYKSIYKSLNSKTLFSLEGEGLEMGIWKKGSQYQILLFNHNWKDKSGKLSVSLPDWKFKTASVSCKRLNSEALTFTLNNKCGCCINISANN